MDHDDERALACGDVMDLGSTRIDETAGAQIFSFRMCLSRKRQAKNQNEAQPQKMTHEKALRIEFQGKTSRQA